MPQELSLVNPVKMTASTTQAMPHDPEAEASVLGAMFRSADVVSECLSMLKANDFYLPRNATIFAAIRDMETKGLPIDPISLADFLKSQGTLERAGGMNYITGIASDFLSVAGWNRHAEILRRDSVLRDMITASSQITALAYDAPEDTKRIVDKAEELIFSVTDRELSSNFESLADIAERVYDEVQTLASTDQKYPGILTGFSSMDDLILGFRPGQMIVVGARPAMGKTAFALNLAVNMASGETGSRASVALFSLEMQKTEIVQRLLASQAQMDLRAIRSGKISNDGGWSALLKATDELSKLDIMIDDTPDITTTEIRAKARRMLHGKENGIVIIDYLQLLSPADGRRAESRAVEVSEMSRAIKIMAKDLGVPVIALSQLNRGTENRTGNTAKKPQLSDLRESGSIEQDADIVILIDRSMSPEEAENGKNRPPYGVTEFNIAKNRSGPVGSVQLTFLGKSTKFVQVTTNKADLADADSSYSYT